MNDEGSLNSLSQESTMVGGMGTGKHISNIRFSSETPENFLSPPPCILTEKSDRRTPISCFTNTKVLVSSKISPITPNIISINLIHHKDMKGVTDHAQNTGHFQAETKKLYTRHAEKKTGEKHLGRGTKGKPTCIKDPAAEPHGNQSRETGGKRSLHHNGEYAEQEMGGAHIVQVPTILRESDGEKRSRGKLYNQQDTCKMAASSKNKCRLVKRNRKGTRYSARDGGHTTRTTPHTLRTRLRIAKDRMPPTKRTGHKSRIPQHTRKRPAGGEMADYTHASQDTPDIAAVQGTSGAVVSEGLEEKQRHSDTRAADNIRKRRESQAVQIRNRDRQQTQRHTKPTQKHRTQCSFQQSHITPDIRADNVESKSTHRDHSQNHGSRKHRNHHTIPGDTNDGYATSDDNSVPVHRERKKTGRDGSKTTLIYVPTKTETASITIGMWARGDYHILNGFIEDKTKNEVHFSGTKKESQYFREIEAYSDRLKKIEAKAVKECVSLGYLLHNYSIDWILYDNLPGLHDVFDPITGGISR